MNGLEAEIIPQYQLSDFKSSDEPYLAVYKYHGVAYDEQKEIDRMDEQAKEEGFKDFKKRYKAFCDKMDNAEPLSSQDTKTAVTNFSDQPAMLACGDWICDDKGVRKNTKNGEIWACPHPIMPTRILKNVETGREKIEISYCKPNQKGGKTWGKLVIDRDVLSSNKKIVDALSPYGIMVISDTAKYLVAYFQDVEKYTAIEGARTGIEYIITDNSVSRLGWINGAFSPYMGDVVLDNAAEHETTYNSVVANGDMKIWLDTINKLREKSIYVKILVAASFAAALVEPMGAMPFFVHLWGEESGTGKTVALMAAVSVWGNPTPGKGLVFTFNSTSTAQERIAAFLNSLPYCMDELQLARDRNGKTNFNVYFLAEGQGRSRGTKSGGIDKPLTWRNTIITTGETPLVDDGAGAGAVNRSISVEVKSGTRIVEKEEGAEVTALLRENYGFAGRMYAEALSDKDFMNTVKQTHKDLRAVMFEKGGKLDKTDKQIISATLLVLGDSVFAQICKSNGMTYENPLTTDEVLRYLASKSEVSTGERGYTAICDWVTQNFNHFKTDGNYNDIYGSFDPYSNTAYIIRTCFDNALKSQGFNPKAVLSWLRDNNKLILRNGRSAKEHPYTTNRRIITGGSEENPTYIYTECVGLRMPDSENEGRDVSDGIPF